MHKISHNVYNLQKIGCDNVLDSEAEEDGCGVCGGSGSTCTIVQDVFTKIKRGFKNLNRLRVLSFLAIDASRKWIRR